MNYDSFLSSPRWEILQIIAESPSSPMEIAQKIKTTVSYVSQQLRILDAAGLLKKEKTGAFEKGKPRSLFGLSEELFYTIILTNGFTKKSLIKLSDYHKRILKIWTVKDPIYHAYIEKIFLELEGSLSEIESINIDNFSQFPVVLIATESKKLKGIIEGLIKSFEIRIQCDFILQKNLSKYPKENLIELYHLDPNDSGKFKK